MDLEQDKMNNPEFSVLMSLYIKEKPEHLNSCLQSLYDQTTQASEIIIVLDGPITTKLQDVLTIWESKLPINFLALKQNEGLGKALNIGLKNCTHEIIFRMDTDDICVANRFELQLSYLEKNPDIDILSCTIEEFDLLPGDSKQFRKAPSRNNISKSIAYKNPINHMGVVYKKSKILSAGSYMQLDCMEDYYLWLRCYSQGYVIDNMEEPLVHARVGNGMLGRRRGMKYLVSEWKLHRIKIDLLNKASLGLLFIIFMARATSRIAPKKIISFIYKLNRQPI